MLQVQVVQTVLTIPVTVPGYSQVAALNKTPALFLIRGCAFGYHLDVPVHTHFQQRLVLLTLRSVCHLQFLIQCAHYFTENHGVADWKSPPKIHSISCSAPVRPVIKSAYQNGA
jgi:hypothetical protein|tara:strand:+ start:3805 stop:4146 length:342 start_codon:yes stop_codon:yes gene_type:complete